MDYPKMDYAAKVLVIRVRKLSASCPIKGHYTENTDLKLDSLSFLTLITKLQRRGRF